MKDMDKAIKKARKVLKPACKVIYYLFLMWAIIVCSIGTYAVYDRFGKPQEVVIEDQNINEYKKKELLNTEIENLYVELGKKYKITLYRIKFETAYTPEVVDILANEGDPYVNRQKRYWQNQPNFKGYSELSSRIVRDRVVYIEDVRKVPEIYRGRTMEDIKKTNTTSIYGMLIQEVPGKSMTSLVLTSNTPIELESVRFYLETRQSAKNISRILNQ